MTTTFLDWSALVKSPAEMPATGALMGTPASISASVPTQTLAIEEEPLEPVISETTRMV